MLAWRPPASLCPSARLARAPQGTTWAREAAFQAKHILQIEFETKSIKDCVKLIKVIKANYDLVCVGVPRNHDK